MNETNFSTEEAKQYEWELCRENVKPVKHGRRVNAINKALTQVTCNAEKTATAKLEEYMEQADLSDDPLSVCLDFCTWFEDSYPSGKQKIFYTLLWKIVHKYVQTDRYQQDIRTLRIWETLADNSMGHGYEVYQHAHYSGCLTENAAFYVKWARELEDRGDIQSAREIIQKAHLKGAIPLNVIQEEEDALEMREMRRQFNKATFGGENDSDEDDNTENERRQVFTRVSALDNGSVPVMRLPSIVGEQGPRTLDVPKTQTKQQTFEVFEDEEKDQENYLEAIYDIHNLAHCSHVDRYTLKDNNNIITKLVGTENSKKKFVLPGPSFTVWEDDKENIDPNAEKLCSSSAIVKTAATGKPKLAFPKEFLHVAIEEKLYEKYLEDAPIRRKLNFDEASP